MTKQLLIVIALASACLAEQKPNIILCMSDDQGWGDVGYNGHPHLKTPHLDNMSEEGVTFTRFYSAAAMCSPTRGSCLTGRNPYRFGVTFAMKGMLEPTEIPIMSILRKQGYATGHFGKWHLGTMNKTMGDQKRWGAYARDPVRYYCPPWERDVDVCFVTESKVPTWDPMVDPKSGGKYGNEYFTDQGRVETENLEGCDSRVLMDRAIPFIQDAAKNNTPFLAVIWFHTPHAPVIAGGKYRKMYAGRPENEQQYFGSITAMDDQIGRLRAELDTLGIAENTMLWFCSDNGPSMQKESPRAGSAKGLSGVKLSIREGGIRVPCVMVWPNKVKQSICVDAPCVTSDYFPTILDALDLPLPADRAYDGISLIPFITGRQTARKNPIGFLNKEGKEAAWIADRHKLLITKTGAQLFDIKADPAEKNDLSKKLPEIRQRMQAELDAWKNGVMTELRTVRKNQAAP
jgi:arylsulfatase A-like enzyme